MAKLIRIKSGNKNAVLSGSEIQDAIFLRYCEMIPEVASQQASKSEGIMMLSIKSIARLIRGYDVDVLSPIELFDTYKDTDPDFIEKNNLDIKTLVDNMVQLRKRLDTLLLEAVTLGIDNVTFRW